MRDAFGGTFMVQLILTFLAIYIAFMALAINYAKAFRIKNSIIDYIERYEGYENAKDMVHNYLIASDYYVAIKGKCEAPKGYSTISGTENRGYCVYELKNTKKVNDGKNTITYINYVVETFIDLNLPFFGINIPISIKGETRTIAVPG